MKSHFIIGFVLLFLSLTTVIPANCQNDCSTAQTITTGEGWTTIELTQSDFWISFVADSTNMYLTFKHIELETIALLNSLVVYSGNCNNLTQLFSFDNGSRMEIGNLVIGSTYFLKFNVFSFGKMAFNINKNILNYEPRLELTVHHTQNNSSNSYSCVISSPWNQYCQPPIFENLCQTVYACAGDNISLKLIDPRPRMFIHGNTVLTFYDWLLAPLNCEAQLSNAGPPDPNPITCYSIASGNYNIGVWERFSVFDMFHQRYDHCSKTFFNLIVLDDNLFTFNVNPEVCVGQDVEFDIPIGYKMIKFSYYPLNNPSLVIVEDVLSVTSHYAYNIPTCGNYSITAQFQPVMNYILFPMGCGYLTKTANIHVGLNPHISFTESCYNEATEFIGTACQGVTTWAWDFGDSHTTYMTTTNTTTSIATSNIYHPNSLYNTYLQVDNGIPECLSSTSTNVTFLPFPNKPEITGNRNNCTLTTTYSLLNVDPTLNYSWSIKNQNGTFTTTSSGFGVGSVTIEWNSNFSLNDTDFEELIVQTVNEYDCKNSDTLNIFQCCEGETIIYKQTPYIPKRLDNTILSTFFPPQTNQYTYPGQIVVNGYLIIDKDFTFFNCSHFKMGPESKIIILPGYTLSFNDACISQLCNYMWDGIYLDNAASKIQFLNNSSIKDATNGIVSTNGGSYLLENSSFRNNYIALQVKDHYEVIGAENCQPLDGIIKNCIFTNDEEDHLLKIKPFIGNRSKTGIEVKLVQGMTVGLNTNLGFRNTFSYMNNGIVVKNADLTIQNNLFNCITNPVIVPYQVFNDAAIASISNNTSTILNTANFIPKLYVGGTGLSKNAFQNCRIGIFNYNQKVSILHNDFIDCTGGIQILDAKSPSYIQCNNLSSSVPEKPFTGIFAENTNLKPKDEIRITNNVITDMQYGIRAINLRSGKTTIHLNNINYNLASIPPIVPPKKAGIFVQNCDYISIRDNDITFAGNAVINDVPRKIGIRITNSRLAIVHENTINHAGTGIYTNGSLKNTQFICNVMDQCYHGFFFGDYTSLSTQGYPVLGTTQGFNTHNSFIGDYTLHNKLMAYQYSIVNTSPISWYFYSNFGSNYTLDNPNLITNYAYELINREINNTAFNICYGPIYETDFDTSRRETLLGDILRNEDTYLELHDQYKYYDKNHLYYLFLNDTSALALGGIDDADYIALYDSIREANPGIIEKYYQNLEDGYFETARLANEDIISDHNFTDNRKKVNTLFLDTWANDDYSLDSIRISILLDLATQLPYYAGDATYTARAMLGINPDDLNLTYNQLIEPGIFIQSAIKIFPQPSDNVLIIENSENFEEGTVIEVFDLIGQNLSSNFPENQSRSYTLSTEKLKSGAYFFRITNPKGLNQTNKFIVTH